MRGQIPIALLAGLACVVLASGCSRAKKNVVSSSSPAEQGGLRLIALGEQLPDELKASGLHTERPPRGTTRAWIEVLDRSIYDVNDAGRRAQFWLTSASSERLTASPDASDSIRDDRQFVVVDIPAGYGPEYLGGSLEATVGGKTIAQWKIDALPEPVKQIADNEPDVTKGEALGYGIRTAGKVEMEPLSTLDPRGIRAVKFNLVAIPTAEARAKNDPVELAFSLSRTTWNAIDFPPGGNWQIPADGVMPIMLECAYGDSVKRIEVPLILRRYRTLVEPIVFKNVRVMAPPADMADGTCRLAATKAQTAVTSSGLKVTLPAGEVEGGIRVPGLTLRLSCEQGYEGLMPSGSPLCRSTGKPVSIGFGLWVNGRLSSFESNHPKAGGFWQGSVGWKRPPGKGPWIIPELKMAVEQRAVLEEKELKLLLPVKPMGSDR